MDTLALRAARQGKGFSQHIFNNRIPIRNQRAGMILIQAFSME